MLKRRYYENLKKKKEIDKYIKSEGHLYCDICHRQMLIDEKVSAQSEDEFKSKGKVVHRTCVDTKLVFEEEKSKYLYDAIITDIEKNDEYIQIFKFTRMKREAPIQIDGPLPRKKCMSNRINRIKFDA